MKTIWDLTRGIKPTPAQQVALYKIDALMVEYRDRIMDESGHQMFLFRLLSKLTQFEPLLKWVHSVPNSAGKLGRAAAGRLVGEGLKAGVFDINWDLPRDSRHGLKIEMKVPRVPGVKGMSFAVQPGRVSDDQHLWRNHYIAMGYRTEICYGWRAALDVILDHLGD